MVDKLGQGLAPAQFFHVPVEEEVEGAHDRTLPIPIRTDDEIRVRIKVVRDHIGAHEILEHQPANGTRPEFSELVVHPKKPKKNKSYKNFMKIREYFR